MGKIEPSNESRTSDAERDTFTRDLAAAVCASIRRRVHNGIDPHEERELSKLPPGVRLIRSALEEKR